MSMTAQGYKFDIVYAVDGVTPASISVPVKASMLDGAIGGLTSAFNDTHFTGLAKVASVVAPLALAVLGTSKVTSGSWIPRRLG